jgi:uncharacterized caspase-like protein/lipoprotein NlpI
VGVLLRRRIVLLRVVFFSFLLLLVSPVAHAAKRVALVIGNSSYRYAGELANPKNDATDMVTALEMHGFTVIPGLDLNRAGLDQKIRAFETALRGAEVGVFFYAGHGLQVSGQNYIVPTDAQLATPAALELELIRLEVVQRIMESENRTNILFLDACRNNPLARNLAQAMGTRSTAIGRGLAPAEAGYGTLVSYSTQPGNVALDGTGGARNSPFTGALVKHMTSSGEDLSRILISVRRDVYQATEGKQVPWEHSALMGPFYFKTPPNLRPPISPRADASDAARSQDAVEQGKAAQNRGEFDQAIAALSEAMRLDPNNPHAPKYRADAYESKNDLDRAMRDYNEAIRLDPTFAAAFNNRGNLYKKVKDFNRAIEDYTEAIRLDPTLAFAVYNRGSAYARKKDFDKAIIDYSNAIRMNGKWVEAFYARGFAYVMKKDFYRAIEDYSEVVRLDPKQAGAFSNRAKAYLEMKDFDRAIANFNEAIRLDSTLVNAFLGRGDAYHSQKDFDKAIPDYNEAIRLDSTVVNAFWGRGNVYHSKKDFDKAILDYSEAIRLDSTFVDAFWGRGNAYWSKGDFDRAMADFREMINLNPKDARAHYRMGLAKKMRGDKSGDADIAKARQLDPSVGK